MKHQVNWPPYRIAVLAGLLCASSLGSASAKCLFDYTPRDKDEADIVAVEIEWCAAAVARDRSRLSRVFADDVSWIEDQGYRNKQSVLHRYLEEVTELGWQQSDVRIRIVGTMAVVQSHIRVQKIVDGKREDSSHPSVDVLQKRNGTWQLVAE